MHKTEGMVKWIIDYLRHIKNLSCHMDIISMKHHLTWPWQECLHIHHPNIHCRTGSVCYILCTFTTYWSSRPWIRKTPFQHISYYICFHVYHLISCRTVHARLSLDEGKCWRFFARSCLYATCKTMHNKIDCNDGDIYCWFSHKFIHSINKKSSVPPATCTHFSD